MLARSLRLLVPVIILIGLTGCGRVFNAMMGLHFYKKEVQQCNIDRMRDQMGLKGTNDLYLTRSYYDHVNAMKGMNDQLQQALLQPLQLRYFDRNGNLVSMVANCHVGGFPNLKWERFHIVDSLPIRKMYFLDSLWTFQSDAAFLRSYNGAVLPDVHLDSYHVNVYWSYRMGRQFKRLKSTMDQMQKRHQREVSIWYVNVDSLYAGEEFVY
jgi:hypothetical protein